MKTKTQTAQRLGTFSLTVLLFLVSAGCDREPTSQQDAQFAAERWSEADDPAQSPVPMITILTALPSQGEAAVLPWPGYAWDTFNDSINYRWSGTGLSPVEKYAQVFGIDNLGDVVSKMYGIQKYDTLAPCASDTQCGNHERCGFHDGETLGTCIPRWWGLCHAWSVASILEPEPRQAVEFENVVFQVNDIKGLLVLTYDRPELVFVSQRCDLSNDLSEIEYDSNKRPQSECRDTNPGTFHVFLANYLGLIRSSFAADIVFDEAVGNLPIRSYRVLNERTISRTEATQLVGDVLSSNAKTIKLFNTEVSYVLSSGATDNGNLTALIDQFTKTIEYQYLLELDSTGAIIGGEWVGTSKTEHPDFLRIPLSRGKKSVAAGFITYARVRQLLSASVQGSTIELVSAQEQGQIGPDERQWFGPYSVAKGGLMDVSVSSPQNVELFIYRENAISTQEYTCRRRHAQTSDPCVVEGPGEFYATVLGRSWDADFELKVIYGRKKQ